MITSYLQRLQLHMTTTYPQGMVGQEGGGVQGGLEGGGESRVADPPGGQARRRRALQVLATWVPGSCNSYHDPQVQGGLPTAAHHHLHHPPHSAQ